MLRWDHRPHILIATISFWHQLSVVYVVAFVYETLQQKNFQLQLSSVVCHTSLSWMFHQFCLRHYAIG